ncbi:MAG: hypothetical protein ACREBG_20990 [Pyrinomonadaceae bacterium]
MFTTPFSGRCSSARHQIFALITAAFFILQPLLFALPSTAVAQVGKRVNGVAQTGRTPQPKPADDGGPNDTGTGVLSLTTLGTAATENFDTLATAGTTNTTLPAGWYITEQGGGARDNEQYGADTGGSGTGDIYSYGAAVSTERALGALRSGTLIPFFGAKITNNTGSTITSLDIAYTGEEWRLGTAARTDRIDFQISTNATDLTTGTYTDVDSLDFTTPNTVLPLGAKDGNAAGNRTTIASSITSQSIPNGATFFIRWTDLDASGADDGLAVDDFSVTPQGAGGGQPTLNINDVTQAEGNAGTTTFNFNVTLTAPAGLGGVTFIINTADGTTNPANAGTDYVAIVNGAGSIPEGNNSTPVSVTVNGDVTSELNETFFVNISNITDANPGDVQGLGTITNDDVTLTTIHDIQGSGSSSPIPGANVTTTGIVTLLRTSSNGGGGIASGFFLQAPDADADANPNTSEGIFVFTSSVPPVAVGDEVNVTGTVVEFNGLTEIGSVTNISLIDSGNPLPTAVTLDTTILDPAAAPTQPQLEKFEAMRMTGLSLNSVAPNDNFFDLFVVLGSVLRPVREPGIEISLTVPPDPTTGVPDCCVPRWDQNPERLLLDTNGRAGAPNVAYTSNVTFTGVAGPLDFAFGQYRLIPDAAPLASGNMSAVPVPSPNAGEFTVAGFNIENFNNNATQRQKAALAIRDVIGLPDIIGTVEIFDLADLQALAVEIQTISGVTYSAHLIEQDGVSEDNDQDVGFLVKTSRVQVDTVTQERATETYINPINGLPEILHDRPPLVLQAHVEPAGANLPVIVVVNHNRSFIDIEQDPGDGPRVRAKRKAQAESIAGLLQELQNNNPTTSVISVGDYNAYQFSDGYTDPVATIKGSPTIDDQIVVDESPDLVNPDFRNLVDQLLPGDQYSFIFEGTPQALDHVFVNTVARGRNTRIAVARSNADFPESPAAAFAGDATRPERCSDHDPLVAYFSLAGPQPQGSVIISEFRLRGPDPGIGQRPNGILPPPDSTNEFIEIYNNTDSDITVSTTDGSSGWAVVSSDGFTVFEIPNGTIIPARGHYLGTNIDGYTLDDYGGLFGGSGDATYSGDLPDDGGIALFRTSDPVNFTLSERLDAVGYSDAPPLYREGNGLPSAGPEFLSGVAEFSFFRDMRTAGGLPKDTGDNTVDFLGASVDGLGTGLGGRLGAPGPENLFSPIHRNSAFGFALLDPVAGAASAPNRVRKMCALAEECLGNRSQFGTLSIRRTVTNNTGGPVSKLRFRVMDITTFPSPGGTADLRPIGSIDIVEIVGGNPVNVRGTQLEEPPVQPNGGGWNSSLNVGFIDLGTPLNNGQSVSVQFLVGVQQLGSFRIFMNVEAGDSSLNQKIERSRARRGGRRR